MKKVAARLAEKWDSNYSRTMSFVGPAATVRSYSSGLCTLCAGCPKEACPTSFGRWGRFAPFFINLFCFELLIFVCLDASAHPLL